MKSIALLLVIAAAGAVAEESLPGAKVIFYNPISDVEVKDTGSAAKGPKKGPRPGQPSGPATGVNYMIELQTPDGKTKMVPSSTIFHTGDRIRLHIKANVDGRLVLMQSLNKGPYVLLFPPRPDIDNHVKKFADNLYPTKTFFRFDEKPGDLVLMLMVTADGANPNMIAVTVPTKVEPNPQVRSEAPTPSPAPAVEPVPGSQPSTQLHASTTPPGGNPDLRAQYDAQVRAEYEKLQAHPKSLVMEDETTGPEPSTTVVSVPWRDRNITPGVIVVEVRLKQQP